MMRRSRDFRSGKVSSRRQHRLQLESLEPRWALTDVSGAITGNTTWDLTGSPYNVIGDITVGNGASLRIEPGVAVRFGSGFGIAASGTGRLVADGTAFDRITFGPTVAGQNWDGLSFSGTLADNRITYADFTRGDAQGESINVDTARLFLDNITWTGTGGTVLELFHPSLIVRNSSFPTSGGGEIIHGEYISGNEYLIIEGNVFANSNNGGDVIDILGADRPGPVMQILGNVFLGGGDDGLDMDGTDAHVEGNLFTNFHYNTTRATTSNAIATGLPQSGEPNRTQVTIVRNIFINNDHHILLKEDAFATVENNVFIDATLAAIQFNEIGGTANNGPAVGAYLDGNIFSGNASLFKNLTKTASPAFQTQLTVNRSLLPNELQTYSDGSTALAHSFGTGNIAANPMFVDAAGGNYRLQPGSPAIGTGPNGIDMGAYVPGGPSISGVPTTPSSSNDLQFTVAGPGITHYRYRLNGGAYGPTTPVATPITLVDLANADYTIDVLGMNDAGEWFAGQTPAYRENYAEIIAPTRTRTGEALPMIVRVRDSHGQVNTLLTTPAALANAADLNNANFRVKKGTGSLSPTVTATGDFTLAMGGSLATGASTRAIDLLDGTYPVQTHSDTLAGNTVWDNTAEHRITGNLTIPAGSSLTIQPGTRVMLGSQVNLIVQGTITVNGTAADPVVFNAINPAQPWGGVEVRGAGNVGTFSYTFFTKGGADTSRNFGHSSSQPLIKVTAATVNCDNCYIINNTGKALAAETNPRLNFDWGVISNNDTGGEIRQVVARITNTWIKDMPDDDQAFVNDDNDGMYFLDDHSSGESSLVQNTYVINTKDDCFDHNGARLNIVSVWFEGCFHEAQSSSDHNFVNVTDTVAIGTNQGYEAGYGSPRLTVDHSVATRINHETEPGDNSSAAEVTAAFRYGDGYNTTNGQYTGDLIATNSIAWDSEDNVRNWDGTGPVPGELDITHSLTNDPDYNSGTGNLAGVPVFGPFMHLLRGSPGVDAGSDGLSMGRLLPPVSRTFTVNSTLPALRINEVLALANGGNSSDLIELSNSGGAAADLSGMSVTNDPAEPLKYTFGPGTTLAPGGSLILYADLALGPPTEHHLGFTLDEAGDEVLLYPSGGGTPVDSVTFGRQLNDRSIARASDGTWRLGQPTLGQPNVTVPTGSASGMRINEWLAAPGGAFATDFIELYNSDALAVDFGGLHLTNDPASQPDLFTIRPLSFVAGNGLLVYLADDNTAAGFDHVNFQLDPSGGTIALTGVNPSVTIDSITYGPQTAGISQGRTPNGSAIIGVIDPPTPGADNPDPGAPDVENLVLIDHEWSYFDAGTNLGTAWRATNYIENGWGSGAAALYNEDDPISAEAAKNTLLDLNADGDLQNTITFYFRTHFTLDADPADIQLQMRRLVDDGLVVYLNGVEVHRFNMPAAPAAINFDTVASATQEATTLSPPIIISKQSLVPDDNVLAVEVHQRATDSSDVVFAMTLDAVEVTDVTPPGVPTNVAANIASSSQVNVIWAAATDPESGINFYNVYRDGTLLGTSTSTSLADTTVTAGQTYQYEVSAVNNADMEGTHSTPVSVSVVNVLMFQDGVFPTPAYTGTRDTWLQQTAPDTNNGADDALSLDVRGTDTNPNTAEWPLVRWDVSAVPPGSTVQDATITLVVNNTSPGTFDLYASLRPWVENQATWNAFATGQPWQTPGGTGASDRGATLVGTFNPAANGATTITLNAAGRDLIESWINSPAENYGLMFSNGTVFNGAEFRSREFATVGSRPKLTLSYSTGDMTPPVITARQARTTVAPQRIEFTFSEDVNVDAADLALVNNTTSQTISPAQMQVVFDAGSNTATWTFPGLPGGVLPSGSYTATLQTASVTDTAGNPTTPNGLETLSFSWLQGDVNESGAIDAADIDFLYDSFSASNTSPVFDLDGDGNVDQEDVDRLVTVILDTHYGDANLDGDVDRADLLVLVTNYGGAAGWATGDFTGDNVVGLADLARQQQNFGLTGGPAPSAPSAILVGHAPRAESIRAITRATRIAPTRESATAPKSYLSPAAVDTTMAQPSVQTPLSRLTQLRARRTVRSHSP
jgi:hypothetical protein